jgi:alanine-glyoxylate transaminase/serine-glyoxylate transaminase/serine-pyruvate transaminase
MDEVEHPALLMVDAISSLACTDYQHDVWRVDVTVASSQKGLMLPPGLSFNAVSEKALTNSADARMPRAFWSWKQMMEFNREGFFPYTPATNLLFGLREAISMLVEEERLDNVYRRHRRLAEATRSAVNAWGLELLCVDSTEFSDSLTAVLLPPGAQESELRSIILNRFDLSLGAGLGKIKGKVFRIGHLGDFNDLMLCGTLCGIEMGLEIMGVPIQRGGVRAALDRLKRGDAGDHIITGSSTRKNNDATT